MTTLIASIAPSDLESLRRGIQQSPAGRADIIEVRVDGFHGSLSQLAEFSRRHARTWIVTCRSADESGGDGEGSQLSPIDRVDRLIEATEGTNCWIDFELEHWKGSAPVRTRLAEVVQASPDGRRRLILSRHLYDNTVPDFARVRREFGGLPDFAIGKFAYMPRDIVDSFPALDAMRLSEEPQIVIAMGAHGSWTRLLAGKLGAFATYCSLTEGHTTAPGQLCLADTVQRYRWSRIDCHTRVFGVIGDPVAHSMSPHLFNHWFDQAGENAVYVPLRVASGSDVLLDFLNGVRARSWLDVGGLSVTIPHKSHVLACQGIVADRHSQAIGAANTLSLRDGAFAAHNTDCYAAIESVADALGCESRQLRDVSFDVLGSGGAASAILAGLHDYGCDVNLYGRSRRKTELLATTFACTPRDWADRVHRSGDVLVNCTPVGMWPAVDDSPMPASALGGLRLVFDMIYNPAETRLLADAKECGANVLNGMDMFIRQAAAQFELWTGKKPDMRAGHELILGELHRHLRAAP